MEMRVGFSKRYRRWWWVLRLSVDDTPLGGFGGPGLVGDARTDGG